MAGPNVAFQHPQYKRMLSRWQKCRDVVSGEDTIKDANTKYLPRLLDQSADEYEAYKNRGEFYEATQRTVLGLAGAIMRKPIKVESSEEFREYLISIGPNGESSTRLASDMVEEILKIGRLGMLVDADPDDADRPYATMYAAETVINWRTDMSDGRARLRLVVLKEEIEVEKDEFATEEECQYRELVLQQDGEKMVYRQRVWRKTTQTEQQKAAGDKPEYTAGEWITPAGVGGRGFEEIPFCFVNAKGVSVEMVNPPILGLANTNLSHYRTSVDLEHGRHYTALPTVFVKGVDPEKSKFKIGSQTAWVTSDTNAGAEYLEFTGAGLGALERGMEQKEKRMAVLGSRLLEARMADAEAADTVKMRHSGEASVLSMIAIATGAGLERVLRWIAFWRGKTKDEALTVAMNLDFFGTVIDANLLEKLMLSAQSGMISWDTFFFQLQRGEIFPPERTPEEERELIEAGLPMGAPASAPGEKEKQETELRKKEIEAGPKPGEEDDPPAPGAPGGAGKGKKAPKPGKKAAASKGAPGT